MDIFVGCGGHACDEFLQLCMALYSQYFHCIEGEVGPQKVLTVLFYDTPNQSQCMTCFLFSSFLEIHAIFETKIVFLYQCLE